MNALMRHCERALTFAAGRARGRVHHGAEGLQSGVAVVAVGQLPVERGGRRGHRGRVAGRLVLRGRGATRSRCETDT